MRGRTAAGFRVAPGPAAVRFLDRPVPLYGSNMSHDNARNTYLNLLATTPGVDAAREGLQDTPDRAARAWAFATSGYAIEPASVLKVFKDGGESIGTDHGMVVQTKIPVWSTCEHHLLPFFGVAHIGYIPDGGVVGLSKFARLVDVFARRLQVQERLGVQIADALMEVVKPLGVGVVLECRHTCMESRGVRAAGTVTTTSALRGAFMDSAVRAEFLALVSRGDRAL